VYQLIIDALRAQERNLLLCVIGYMRNRI